MKTVTVLNRKGGCAKTSTCFHASAAFAARGLRVLLVDLDPQANLKGCTKSQSRPIIPA